MSQVVAEAVFRILQIGELVSDLLVCCHQSYFLKDPDLSICVLERSIVFRQVLLPCIIAVYSTHILSRTIVLSTLEPDVNYTAP